MIQYTAADIKHIRRIEGNEKVDRTGAIYCSTIETQLNDTAERYYTTRRHTHGSAYLHIAYATVYAIAVHENERPLCIC